jgi:pyruvate dehydrogenase E1 component alpha subunit
LAIGQEHVSAGICSVLQNEDVVGGSYRSHAVYIAKGGSVPAMMAEMYGKDTGCARGKGGSMHMIGPEANVLGSSAVVGTGIPVAAGHALAIKQRGEKRVVAVFFGDGATEEGCFYETLNFASLHKLPILFVCENNGYAIHEPLSKRWANEDICGRVRSFSIPSHRIDDGDVLAIRWVAAEAVERIRSGGGPEFMECLVYRWLEHVGPSEDFDQGYRSRAEADPWIKADQMLRLGGMLTAPVRDCIDKEIEAEVAAAVEFAETSSIPDPQELYSNVYD